MFETKNILVTGGAGFIGSSFVNLAMKANHRIIVLDKLTYSGNLANLTWIKEFDQKRSFIKGDIADASLVTNILEENQIDWIVNFAAESHVDNSIKDPSPFIQTNILGTYQLLQTSLKYFEGLNGSKKEDFRFLHISTDEVFGDLDEIGKFSEESSYNPSSPYSASKASSDHLVRAWHRSYNLPILITNCSNNFGPRQYPEKLIPKMILNAVKEEMLPIYGEGKNTRDWIFVDDHNLAVLLVLAKGKIGDTYCIGASNERTNNEVLQLLCQELDLIKPRASGQSYLSLIQYVRDRSGHDFRYAIDASKIKSLGFKPSNSFETALKDTILWYLENKII